MPEIVTTPHPTSFVLLRLVAEDVNDIERVTLQRHLGGCAACLLDLQEIAHLDSRLREQRDEVFREAEAGELEPEDPFRTRPEGVERPAAEFGFSGPDFARFCLEGSRAAELLQARILADVATKGDALSRTLDELDLKTLAGRFGLNHALHERLQRIVDGPGLCLELARHALVRLRREPFVAFSRVSGEQMTPVEFACPLAGLLGGAYLLAGAARNWTGEFELGEQELQRAYRFFRVARGDSFSLALVEHHEAQRRAFLGRVRPAHQSLVLLDRAALTFQELGYDDHAARSWAARGLALSALEREEEALEAFRSALPVFASYELWSAYVTTLNNIGNALVELRRPEEARREYARALRRVSSAERPSVHAFVRSGLALTLFRSARFGEAARAFAAAARLFEDQGATADALISTLHLIECQARLGNRGLAASLLEEFQARVAGYDALDQSIVAEIAESLAGERPDLERVSTLRGRFEEQVRRSFPKRSA
jgi:tetratricopeptide (TPR) repeat protein